MKTIPVRFHEKITKFYYRSNWVEVLFLLKTRFQIGFKSCPSTCIPRFFKTRTWLYFRTCIRDIICKWVRILV